MFTLYTSDVRGDNNNCKYPYKHIITDKASLIEATSHDFVAATYKNNYRNGDNFMVADCLPMDCDNDHSEDPSKWITAQEIKDNFPNVSFAIHYSRHNNKVKGSKSARPRFHVLFPIRPCYDEEKYKEMKDLVQMMFPFFDKKAMDTARFFYGTEEPDVEFYEGDVSLSDYLDFFTDRRTIHEGCRNDTMSKFAARVIKKYGDTDKAYEVFLEKAELCEPPLDDSELNVIWHSAQKFYEQKILKQSDYVAPEAYNNGASLEPEDYSDVGQAEVLAREYKNRLRYSRATDYIVYNGSYWEESEPMAQGVSQELTDRQLKEAEERLKKAAAEMKRTGVNNILDNNTAKKAVRMLNEEQTSVYEEYNKAVQYKKYVIRRRDSGNIASTLKEARPMLKIEPKELDNKEFLLNCPSVTLDLRNGVSSMREHDSEDLIMKQTEFDPSDAGMELWKDALNVFFQGDTALIDYVQQIVGLAAIGKVYQEALIIAYGDGANGKSTFWNTILKVMGSYGGTISADALTVGCKRNVKPEVAEIKGKRIIIASELEEGMRLSTSLLKQLCSIDDIEAEKKFKDPFRYTPTHTLVLYTNHLPKVGAIDKGTWRRLIVIPFNAKIEGSSDIKNYTEHLVKNAGGAILTWIIEGARKAIKESFKPELPDVVCDAINEYRENNDWIGAFLEECCEIDESCNQKSGELYQEYRAYCTKTGEFARSTADFYKAIDALGFKRYRNSKARYVKGLRLKSEFDD